jgi:hypothetical protein
MNIILFFLMVTLQWGLAKMPGFYPAMFFLPMILFAIVEFVSSKRKVGLKWWTLLIMLPASIIGVDIIFQLPARLTKGISYSLEQFNETALWALGIGLIQFGVFYICYWLWVVVKKSRSQK